MAKHDKSTITNLSLFPTTMRIINLCLSVSLLLKQKHIEINTQVNKVYEIKIYIICNTHSAF